VYPFVDTVTIKKLLVPQNTGISCPVENQQGPQEGLFHGVSWLLGLLV